MNDLIDAMQDANVLPRRVPSNGGFTEHRQRVERLGLEFALRYRLAFGNARFDAYLNPEAPGGNEVRLGVPLRQAAVEVQAFDSREPTGQPISSFQYAISGRAFVYGSLLNDPNTRATHFVIWRLPEFVLDDKANRIPPVLPLKDTERLLSRAVNREIRVRPDEPQNPGIVSFPINFKFNPLPRRSVSYGLQLSDPGDREDPLSTPRCLPPGFGEPSCDRNATPTRGVFFENLDTYMRVETNREPVRPPDNDKDVQLEVGWKVIQREISKDNKWNGDWEEVAAKLFRYRAGHRVNWDRRSDGTGAIKVEFQAELQVAYPKIKWCKKSVKIFGKRVSFKYPCGIRRGWHPVKSVYGMLAVRLEMEGQRACVKIVDHRFSGKTNILGVIISAGYLIGAGAILAGIAGVMGPFIGAAGGLIAGVFVAAGVLILTLLVLIEHIADALLDLLPNEICANVRNFLTLPVIEDKVDVKLNDNLIHFDNNGIVIATTPDFKSKVLIDE